MDNYQPQIIINCVTTAGRCTIFGGSPNVELQFNPGTQFFPLTDGFRDAWNHTAACDTIDLNSNWQVIVSSGVSCEATSEPFFSTSTPAGGSSSIDLDPIILCLAWIIGLATLFGMLWVMRKNK